LSHEGQKDKKTNSNNPYSKLLGLIENSSIISGQSDTTGTSKGTWFYGQTNLKKEAHAHG